MSKTERKLIGLIAKLNAIRYQNGDEEIRLSNRIFDLVQDSPEFETLNKKYNLNFE